jgi:hypothetical protein
VATEVDADLGHGVDHHRVDGVGGRGTGGANDDPVAGVMWRGARGHL